MDLKCVLFGSWTPLHLLSVFSPFKTSCYSEVWQVLLCTTWRRAMADHAPAGGANVPRSEDV